MPLQREDSLKRSFASEPRHEIIFKIDLAAEWRSGKLQGARLKGSWRERKAIPRQCARANAGKGIGVEFGFRFGALLVLCGLVRLVLLFCVALYVFACACLFFFFLFGGGWGYFASRPFPPKALAAARSL